MTQTVETVFTRSFIIVMAITCGVCAGANYYNQPLIYAMAESLGVSVEQTAVTIVITQFGYAFGLICFAPLGDKFSKRHLILSLMLITAIAQICIGFSQQLWSLYFFTFVSTIFSVAAQVLIPFISGLSAPQKMAQTIGTLMGGIFIGILLARAYAGLISSMADWHTVYLTSGGLILILAAIMYFKLPVPQPNAPIKITAIYKSLWDISLHSPHLMRRGLVGALSLASVILSLSTMALVLANPPYSYSELEIGFFGLVGIAGVFATRWAGKKVGLKQENTVAYTAGTLIILQWLLMMFAQQSIWIYILGLIVGYVSVSVMQILNQSLVLRHADNTRSRRHSIYMFMYFLGAAVGSSAGLYAWSHWGWFGCCVMGLSFGVLMLIVDRWDYHMVKNIERPV